MAWTGRKEAGMSGQHRRGHSALPSGGTVQALGASAVATSVILLLLAAALSVVGAVQSSAAPGARPAAATASPTSDGPVTQPRDATAQPGATTASTPKARSTTTAAKPGTLVKTGAPSGALLAGALLAFAAGVVLLLVGRELPFGRHERSARHLAAS
jgi:hypothetical protein